VHRFFFDIDDGDTSTVDDEGILFRDLDEARAAAIITLVEIARECMPGDGLLRDSTIEIRNDADKALLQVVVSLHVTSEASANREMREHAAEADDDCRNADDG
jgi:hypothetical protein